MMMAIILLMSLMISFFLLLRSYYMNTTTATIYTLSLHDALPICSAEAQMGIREGDRIVSVDGKPVKSWEQIREWTIFARTNVLRSEEHTSELQSQSNLVFRLLLEKNNKHDITNTINKRSQGIENM